jgi:hypothetical protein
LGEDQTEENVEFDWELKMISKKELEIQMDFSKAIYVSANSEIDQVSVSFNNPDYFQSAYGSKPLELSSISIDKVLPPQ